MFFHEIEKKIFLEMQNFLFKFLVLAYSINEFPNFCYLETSKMLKFGCLTHETNLANDHFLESLTLTWHYGIVVVGPGTFFIAGLMTAATVSVENKPNLVLPTFPFKWFSSL